MEGPKKGTEERRFRGVQKRPSGNYEAHIRDRTKPGGRRWLGTYETAEKAARAYDRAALSMKGNHATLNFPHEDYSTQSGGSEKGSSSSSAKHREVFEIPCLPDEVLEELLAFEEKKD